jgi:hypothetical protein
MKLKKEGSEDPVLSYWMIRHLKGAGKADEAEYAKSDACRKWPKQQEFFEKA